MTKLYAQYWTAVKARKPKRRELTWLADQWVWEVGSRCQHGKAASQSTSGYIYLYKINLFQFSCAILHHLFENKMWKHLIHTLIPGRRTERSSWLTFSLNNMTVRLTMMAMNSRATRMACSWARGRYPSPLSPDAEPDTIIWSLSLMTYFRAR